MTGLLLVLISFVQARSGCFWCAWRAVFVVLGVLCGCVGYGSVRCVGGITVIVCGCIISAVCVCARMYVRAVCMLLLFWLSISHCIAHCQNFVQPMVTKRHRSLQIGRRTDQHLLSRGSPTTCARKGHMSHKKDTCRVRMHVRMIRMLV